MTKEACHIEALRHDDKVTFLINRKVSYSVELTSLERSVTEQIALLDNPLTLEVLVDPATKNFKCTTYDETCKQVVDVKGTVEDDEETTTLEGELIDHDKKAERLKLTGLSISRESITTRENATASLFGEKYSKLELKNALIEYNIEK